jgi:hypothetical protein
MQRHPVSFQYLETQTYRDLCDDRPRTGESDWTSPLSLSDVEHDSCIVPRYHLTEPKNLRKASGNNQQAGDEAFKKVKRGRKHVLTASQ